MAIAIQIQPLKQSKFSGFGRSILLGALPLYGMWCFIRAYLIIVGIAVLTGLSLMGLHFHNQFSKLRLKLNQHFKQPAISDQFLSNIEVEQISQNDRCC